LDSLKNEVIIMKTQRVSFRGYRILSRMVVIVLPCLIAANAHAATASGTFTMSLGVNSPVCTVSTNNATLTLPTVTSQNQTLGNYFSTNAITTAGQFNASWLTSTAFNQTATITCTTPSTPILSFYVSPAPGASIAGSLSGQAFLVDSASAKAAAGNLEISYEQVSINGTATPFAYVAAGIVSAYTTVFSTSAVANGIATVVWRPTLFNGSATTAMGTPNGGSYSSPGQIVVNY
jgi:hypothetical protein